MTGVTDVEVANLEHWKLLLERSIKNGLPSKIPNFEALVEHVKSQIDKLLPNGVALDGDEKRKKEKENEANIEAAASVMEEHQRLVSQGFNNKEDFFTFGKNLENDNYWNWLNHPDNEEEKKKVAENFYGDMNEQLRSGKLNVNDAVSALTPMVITLSTDAPVQSQETFKYIEEHKDELTPEMRAKWEADKKLIEESRKSEDVSVRIERINNLQETHRTIVPTNETKEQLVQNTQAVEKIDDGLADLAAMLDSPEGKSVAQIMQKSKMQEGELAANEPNKEEVAAKLRESGTQDKGEVQNTGVIVFSNY